MTRKRFASGITALGLTAMAATAPSSTRVHAIHQAGAQSQAGAALEFEAGKAGLAIADLIVKAKRVTGEEFFFRPEDLTDARVAFSGTLTVQREKFLSFFDWCLREAGFIDVEHDVASARSHSIVKTIGFGSGAGRAMQALRGEARVVDRAQLDVMSDRFVLVTTTYCSKHVAARDLVTKMSLFFADSPVAAIRNIEGCECIVMTGCATTVSAVCAMMDRVDAQTGESEKFRMTQELARRIAALEAEVGALVQRAK